MNGNPLNPIIPPRLFCPGPVSCLPSDIRNIKCIYSVSVCMYAKLLFFGGGGGGAVHQRSCKGNPVSVVTSQSHPRIDKLVDGRRVKHQKCGQRLLTRPTVRGVTKQEFLPSLTLLIRQQTKIFQVTGGGCLFQYSLSEFYAAVTFTTTPYFLADSIPSLNMHKRCHLNLAKATGSQH